MLLDELYQTIEKLNGRMETHRDKLSQSEVLTRNALVDPLLRCLGWDTEDPSLVMPEHKLGNGFADYALLNGDKPVIVVEAKKLDTPLDDAASQGIHYCVNDGIEYFAVTDGRKWNIYETHRKVPLADKKIVDFDITNSPADVCLDALALWRRGVQSNIVRKARTLLQSTDSPESLPIQPYRADALPKLPEVQLYQADALPKLPAVPLMPMPKSPVVPPATKTDDAWKPLSQVEPRAGDKLPSEIRFPDGSTRPIKRWVGIPEAIVNWLIQQGSLDETGIPLRFGNGTRYILSRCPVHSNKTNFQSPKECGQFYLDTKYNNFNHIKNANLIIEKIGKGVRPEQFSVRLPG